MGWLKAFATAAVFGALMPLCADVRLPRLLADHMLLQRGVPVRIWGWAAAGEQVTVEFRSQTAKAQADQLGRWAAYLNPMEAGGPFTMTVAGKNKIEIEDVLVGEVWVASGQSNMVLPVNRSSNAEQEIAAADFPRIRLFQVAAAISEAPLDDVGGSWMACSAESVSRFSAAGYFFARHLHQKLGVPVAVIQSAWGATPADTWISGPAIAADPGLVSVFADGAKWLEDYPENYARYERQLAEWRATKSVAPKPAVPVGPGSQRFPSHLYNSMIAPLTPYAIRGVIWYQGESNSGRGRAYVYRRLFRALIEDWRRAWGQGDFPFLFVQLASFKAGPMSEWVELREAQTMALALRNTGMAVTTDIGDPDDVHPKNKQDVGLRLGLAARAIAYGENVVQSGPMFRQLTREGSALRLWFDHMGGGLVAKGGALKGFQIAGANGKYVAADARIENGTVVAASAEVRDPVSVRYAWADVPEGNLYNAEGLPASPFRTDRWMEPLAYRATSI